MIWQAADLTPRHRRSSGQMPVYVIQLPRTTHGQSSILPYPCTMRKSRLDSNLQARLGRLAAERGVEPELLAREAIANLVEYDTWFIGQVEEGIAAADRGETLSHQEVGERLNILLVGKRDPRA